MSKGTIAAVGEKEKKLSKPAWFKNTYFWISGILLILGIIGFAMGPQTIRDPGQKREDNLLPILYVVGAAIMLVNGYLSHSQTVQHYRETLDSKE